MTFVVCCRTLNANEIDTFVLPQPGTSWITVNHLPESLALYASEKYDMLFGLRPKHRGQIVLRGKTIESPRWHQSFLSTPIWNQSFEKYSYMFGGKETDVSSAMPKEFQPFLDFLNRGQTVPFNQVVINWYETGADYTAAHSDCELGMLEDAEIATLTLGESNRPFRIREKGGEHFCLEVICGHGTILTMFGDMQKCFLHEIPKQPKCSHSRISVTFRKFKACET